MKTGVRQSVLISDILAFTLVGACGFLAWHRQSLLMPYVVLVVLYVTSIIKWSREREKTTTLEQAVQNHVSEAGRFSWMIPILVVIVLFIPAFAALLAIVYPVPLIFQMLFIGLFILGAIYAMLLRRKIA